MSIKYLREGAEEGEGKGHELMEKMSKRKVGKQKMLGKAVNKDYGKGKAT